MAPTSPVALQAVPSRSPLSALEAFFSMQRESAAMRFVARGVLTTWLLPLFFALLASFQTPAAQAQGAPAANVIVLDFATIGGLDPLLGRKAADGLAVELQRSGSYDVVPRQRVEDAVGEQAGLQPPYNDIAQIKLAEAVNATSVFSGRITDVQVNQGRSARVTLEARQLDVITGDYINGTVVSESTEQKLGTIDNEILVDEAINKAVFGAVRSMRQTTLPVGTVLNVATDEVVLSIGADAGTAQGQRFTVLRDKYDAARNVTERSKIGELTITRVNATQSSARVSAGGREGVRTGDRVRQIFEPTNYPRTSLRDGNSVTPVTAPPQRANGGNVAGGFLKKSQAGILGLLGLAGLVAVVGLGGGSGTSSPRGVDITEANPTQLYPQPRFTFNAGFSGIGLSQSLDRESVVAYIIYRGTAPDFTPDVNNVQAVVDARFDASNKNVTFTDSGIEGGFPFRRALIEPTATGGGNNNGAGGNNGSGGGASSIDVTFTEVRVDDNTTLINTISNIGNTINIAFTQKALLIGQTYYYRVGRITAERQRSTNTNNNNQGNNNQGNNTTTVTLLPVRSPVSQAVGGYTPLFLPQIAADQEFNTDNFSVRVTTDLSAFSFGTFSTDANGNIIGFGNFDRAFAYDVPNPGRLFVGAGVDQFRFEVSTSQAFPRSSTFVSPDLPNPGIRTDPATGLFNIDVVLTLGNGGDIRIPSTPTNPYIPGVTPLFIRVLARSTTDSNPTFRVSQTLRVDNAAGQNRVSGGSRFLPSANGAGSGINLTRPGGPGARTQPTTGTPRVVRPE